MAGKCEAHHHWVIDPAKGPTSRGRCRNCGERRNFNNAGSAKEARSLYNPKGIERAYQRGEVDRQTAQIYGVAGH